MMLLAPDPFSQMRCFPTSIVRRVATCQTPLSDTVAIASRVENLLGSDVSASTQREYEQNARVIIVNLSHDCSAVGQTCTGSTKSSHPNT